jgi:hypothetical protein
MFELLWRKFFCLPGRSWPRTKKGFDNPSRTRSSVGDTTITPSLTFLLPELLNIVEPLWYLAPWTRLNRPLLTIDFTDWSPVAVFVWHAFFMLHSKSSLDQLYWLSCRLKSALTTTSSTVAEARGPLSTIWSLLQSSRATLISMFCPFSILSIIPDVNTSRYLGGWSWSDCELQKKQKLTYEVKKQCEANKLLYLFRLYIKLLCIYSNYISNYYNNFTICW